MFDCQRADLLIHFVGRVVVSAIDGDSKLNGKLGIDGKVRKLRPRSVRACDGFFQFVARVLLVKLVVNVANPPQCEPIKNAFVKARVFLFVQGLQPKRGQVVVANSQIYVDGGLYRARVFFVGQKFSAYKKLCVVVVVFPQIIGAPFYSFLNVSHQAKLLHGFARGPVTGFFCGTKKILLRGFGIVFPKGQHSVKIICVRSVKFI